MQSAKTYRLEFEKQLIRSRKLLSKYSKKKMQTAFSSGKNIFEMK